MRIENFVGSFEGNAEEWERLMRAIRHSGTDGTPEGNGSSRFPKPGSSDALRLVDAIQRLWREIGLQSQRAVIASIVEHGGEVVMNELLRETGHDSKSLRGALSGITRKEARLLPNGLRLIEPTATGYHMADAVMAAVRPLVEATTRDHLLAKEIEAALDSPSLRIVHPYKRASEQFELWFYPNDWDSLGLVDKDPEQSAPLLWVERTYSDWTHEGVNWHDLHCVIGIPPRANPAKAKAASAIVEKLTGTSFGSCNLKYEGWAYLRKALVATNAELAEEGLATMKARWDKLVREDFPKITAALKAAMPR